MIFSSITISKQHETIKLLIVLLKLLKYNDCGSDIEYRFVKPNNNTYVEYVLYDNDKIQVSFGLHNENNNSI